jgi:hypothetical protein
VITFLEGANSYIFSADVQVRKYDEETFYTERFQSVGGSAAAVDFIALYKEECWLIECKDYSIHAREKEVSIVDEWARKGRDTLAGLVCAAINYNDGDFSRFARDALLKRKLRLVLHLQTKSRLHHQAALSALQSGRLKRGEKRRLKCIDPRFGLVTPAKCPPFLKIR